jgi:Ser/Thr protein kinase RdoA (MazF antagonist)
VTFDLRRVLSAYPPAVTNARWTPLGSAGGFSGAHVWRGRTAGESDLCLKAHAAGADATRLERVLHRWMLAARTAGLDFVPRVEPTSDGRTVVEAAGRVWDVTAWMPGRADFHANPTDARLVAAVEALARLHEVWGRIEGSRPRPCPAVERRWDALRAWTTLVESGWIPRPPSDDPVSPHVAAAWSALPGLAPRARFLLAPWLGEPVPVQPCLCDVWHDHVLFTGDRVTGLIDYGAAKVDHVAVDLARLLRSFVPGEPERVAVALQAYRAIRPLPRPELVDVLDRTGVVVAVTNWLRWLYHDGRVYPDRAAVAGRIGELVRRFP